MKTATWIVLLAACGSSSSPARPDAAKPIDGPLDSPVDSPVDGRIVDASIDAPQMSTGMHHHYVIDHVYVASTAQQIQQYGLDLDGNGMVDNVFGAFVEQFSQNGFGSPQVPVSQEVDNGALLMLADLQATDLTTATAAAFETYEGTNPMPEPCLSMSDTVCRQHLMGTGSFDVVAQTPPQPPIVGDIVAGAYTGGPGHLDVMLPVFDGMPVPVTLIGARAKLTTASTSIMAGVIGGGITASDMHVAVYPSMAQAANIQIFKDCGTGHTPPTCGCTAGSSGATLVALFDNAPQDCAISAAELEGSSFLHGILAPDVMLEGQMALSVGFGFTAVPGTFTP